MRTARPPADRDPAAALCAAAGVSPSFAVSSGMAVTWLWAAAALLVLAVATPAWARSHQVRIPGSGQRAGGLRPHVIKAKVSQNTNEIRRSVVLEPGILAALDRPQLAGLSERIRVSDPEWLANHAARVPGRKDVVRCDLCSASAADFQPGAPGIVAPVDVRSWTNRLTTLQISDATVKLTSLSPLGLQLRKSF